MELKKYKFIDLLQPDKGVMKGPFGGDIKKEFFVPKSADTYKVYEQSVVYNKNHRVGKYYISSERFSKLKRFEVKPKDILVSGAGTLGELYELPEDIEPGIINQALIRLRINENIVDRGFFKYYFSWYIKVVACRQIGASVIPNFPPIEDLKKITVLLPDLPTQHKIASVLSVLDSKIALNRAINRNLEAFAKQLYDYWFVQFDFPDEKGRPYKSSGGSMVWNEKLNRRIPERWHCGSLFEIASFTNGIACQKFRPKQDETSLPVIKIKEMHDGITADTESVTCQIPESVKVYNGDVLFSWSASLEVMLWAFGAGGLNQHIFKVTSTNGFPKTFYYFQLLDYVEVFKNMAEARKTTMGHITQDHLQQSTIAIPDDVSIAKSFENMVSPIFDKIIKLQEEIAQLKEQRDELLPLLMNGQVSVNSDL